MSTSRSHVSRRFTATLAILFFLIPLVLFIAWSSVSLKYGPMSENDQIQTFLNYFPALMQNFKGIHIFSMICCFIAIILASRSVKKKLLSVRVLMFLVMIGSIFLIIFDIAQLIQ